MPYGSDNVVKEMLSIESGDPPSDEMIANALVIANAEIESRLKKNLLKISGSEHILDSVANYYALAESLAPVNTGLEDENQKSKYYNSRADHLLEDFIIGAIEEFKNSKIDDNHYSVRIINSGSNPDEYLRD